MQIDRLSLRGFRNYEDAQAQFVPGVNLLVGGNANGKTNLLEAVSYLSTGRSFRTRREAELIRFGADFAELRAQVQSQERTRELRAEFLRILRAVGGKRGAKTPQEKSLLRGRFISCKAVG